MGAKAAASTGAAKQQKGVFGLPVWLAEGANVLYKSSSGKLVKVAVKVITSDKVKILFTDGKTWKSFTHSQVLAKDGPLKPQSLDDGAAAGPLQGPAARNRSRSPVASAARSVEVLDEDSDDVVVGSVEVLDD